MSGPHLALLVVAMATLAVFLVGAGICFTPGPRPAAWQHLVKVTGPLSCVFTMWMIWRGPVSDGAAGVAMLLFLGGLALFASAQWVTREDRLTRVFSSDRPEHLVTRGAYRLVRHPCYLSYLLAFTAGLVARPGWVLAAVVGVNVALYTGAALFEERKFAQSALRDAHADYCRRTGMLLPNPLKLFR